MAVTRIDSCEFVDGESMETGRFGRQQLSEIFRDATLRARPPTWLGLPLAYRQIDDLIAAVPFLPVSVAESCGHRGTRPLGVRHR
jgi:hypothetical protein